MQQMFFIADLIACSTCFGNHYAHHQEFKSIIRWLLPVVFRAVVFKLLVCCGAAIKTSVATSWHFISTYDKLKLHVYYRNLQMYC